MATTEAVANAILDGQYGSGSPATIYFGLFTAAPSADGTGGTEVSGGSYARAAVTNNDTEFPDAVDREKTNANAITFAQATALWGNVTHLATFDAATAGNRIDFGPLANPRTINNGDTYSIAPTQWVVTQG